MRVLLKTINKRFQHYNIKDKNIKKYRKAHSKIHLNYFIKKQKINKYIVYQNSFMQINNFDYIHMSTYFKYKIIKSRQQIKKSLKQFQNDFYKDYEYIIDYVNSRYIFSAYYLLSKKQFQQYIKKVKIKMDLSVSNFENDNEILEYFNSFAIIKELNPILIPIKLIKSFKKLIKKAYKKRNRILVKTNKKFALFIKNRKLLVIKNKKILLQKKQHKKDNKKIKQMKAKIKQMKFNKRFYG